MVAGIGAVVNRNLLLVRYLVERFAKSFKRGELQRRWGRKVTIGKTRSKIEVRGTRVRGVTRVFELVSALAYLVSAKVTLNPHRQKPAYAAPKFSPRA